MEQLVTSIFKYLILAIGVIYAAVLLRKSLVNGKLQDSGSFPKMALGEAFVFFFSAMGFSDILQNMFLFNRFGWVEQERIPGTLVTAGVVPGAVIAFYYLNSAEAVDLKTLLPCAAAILLGSYLGSRFLMKMDGRLIRKIMFYALIFSMAALIIKLIVSNGVSADGTSLSLAKTCIAVPVIFLLGFINPFGVPMKPAATALFLLLGLSPVTTLTIMLVLGAISPAASGIRIIRAGRYQKKVAAAGLSAGSLGAVLGCALAVSMDQLLLTIILLIIIAVTIVSMKKKG